MTQQLCIGLHISIYFYIYVYIYFIYIIHITFSEYVCGTALYTGTFLFHLMVSMDIKALMVNIWIYKLYKLSGLKL